MAERSREHALKACIGEWGEAITEALTRALNAEGIEDSDDPILFVSEHLARGRGLVSQQAATIERLRAEVRALKQRTFGAGSGSTNALPVVAAAMPPALRGFAPLASDAAVQAIVPRVRDAEAAAVAGSGVEAAVGQLRAHLAELQAALQAAADARLAHAGIVATCDGVIAAGADFFAGVYREVYATVAQTEADGLAALADALAGAVAGASGDAAQRTSSALALYLDAAAVRPAARALVEEIAGEVEGAPARVSARAPRRASSLTLGATRRRRAAVGRRRPQIDGAHGREGAPPLRPRQSRPSRRVARHLRARWLCVARRCSGPTRRATRGGSATSCAT